MRTSDLVPHGVTPTGRPGVAWPSVCPVCAVAATFAEGDDRFYHNDGSSNRDCWHALGQVAAALGELGHGHPRQAPETRGGIARLADAAREKGVHPVTLRRRVADGSLPAFRLGPRLLYVRLSDVDALFKGAGNADE